LIDVDQHPREIGIATSPVEIGPAPRQVASWAATRLSAFYAAAFLVTGAQLPFWPVWLASRGFGAKEIGTLFAAAIWAKVTATPAIGALADRYTALWPSGGFWAILALNIVALTAQSALTPLGDTVTMAASRADGLDYGRIRVWGSLSFILASLAAGAVLAHTSAGSVLPLVLGASALLLTASCAIPSSESTHNAGSRRPGRAGLRLVAANPQFWVFVASAAALQASHQVYYGFGTLYWRSLGFSETTIGWLWAEGVVAEVLLFWHGRRLLARFGPVGLMALGGIAGVIRWGIAGFVVSLPSTAALQLLHALTFGAAYLGAMHFLSRNVPPAAAASAQTLFAAASSGLGGGLVMIAAGALYAAYGGRAYLAMAALSAVGLCGMLCLRFTRSRPGTGG
jgi:MFS transporter, PPP family, 3-phenylpropionic acid transporter